MTSTARILYYRYRWVYPNHKGPWLLTSLPGSWTKELIDDHIKYLRDARGFVPYGPHNYTDDLYGWCLKDGAPSGWVSFEFEETTAPPEGSAGVCKNVPKNPIQPTVLENGVKRFKKNAIVAYLSSNSNISDQDLARIPFSDDDRQQYAQLTGYSVDGYSELNFSDPIVLAIADRDDPLLNENEARIKVLERKLALVTENLRKLTSEVFDICPEDLELR